MRLSQDGMFVQSLQKACKNNSLRYDDIQNCVKGLYHSASKDFHEHEQQIVIDSRSWSTNEFASTPTMANNLQIDNLISDHIDENLRLEWISHSDITEIVPSQIEVFISVLQTLMST